MEQVDEDTILKCAISDPAYLVPAAIIFAGRRIALQLKYLGNGDAATPMGALEALGEHLGEKISEIATAISALAP